MATITVRGKQRWQSFLCRRATEAETERFAGELLRDGDIDKDMHDAILTVKCGKSPIAAAFGMTDAEFMKALESIDEDVVAAVARDLAGMPGKTGKYGTAWVHHGKSAVHYTMSKDDSPEVAAMARLRFGSLAGVKSVTIKAEEDPQYGDSWRQVYPDKHEHKNFTAAARG